MKKTENKINLKTHKWIKAPFGGYMLVGKKDGHSCNDVKCWTK